MTEGPVYSSCNGRRLRRPQQPGPLKQPVLVVPSSRIAGLKFASMSVHTRETAFKPSLPFVSDPMVPRGIERLDGEWLVLRCCHATDVRLEWAPVESSARWGNG